MPQEPVIEAFESVKRGPGRPKTAVTKEAPPETEGPKTVKIIIHTSQAGDDRIVKIHDPRTAFDSGKKLRLPRNEAIEVDYRVPDLLKSIHQIKVIEEQKMVDGELRPVRREVTIPRFPFNYLD